MSNERIIHNPAPVIPGIADSTRLKAGDMVFISGQVGLEEDGSAPQDFVRAVELGYAELERALKAVGATYDNLVRVNAYVTHLDQERLKLWRETRDRVITIKEPCTSTVIGVSSLFKGALFEIDAIAAV